MTDPQSDNPAPDAWRFNPRAFLAREWPYLLMLILALFGVAYTSFSKTPMTMYWIALAPFIGVICVVTRWRDAENREQRLRLIWTQALHWGAVLLAMHLMFVADVSRMMNADGSALAALTVLALGTFTAGVHIGAWRICLVGIVLGAWGPGHRMARTIGAASAVGGRRSRSGHCTILLAWQMGRQASTVAIRIKIRANIYFDETAMTIANVDDFGRNVRSAVRHHWVLFLIPGIVMAIFGLLAAAQHPPHELRDGVM